MKIFYSTAVYRLENTAIFMMIRRSYVFLYVNTLAIHTKDLKFKGNAHSNVM